MFQELNQNTGLLLFLCFSALVVCYRAIVVAGTAVEHFHKDYRKVNRLDEREDLESEA
jgi:hypothetical protein